MIWKNRPDLEMLNTMQKDTIGGTLGIEFTELTDDYLEATMPVDARTKQPFGILHGGASVTLAETLGSVASMLSVEDPSKTLVFGVEINANHLNSAKSGKVIGRVTPIKVGRNIHVWNIHITDERDRPICTSRLTTMVRRNT